MQVRTLQQAFDDKVLAKQQELAAFLRLRASEDNAGVSLTLPSEAYKDVRGQVGRQGHFAHCVAVHASSPTAGSGCWPLHCPRSSRWTPCPCW